MTSNFITEIEGTSFEFKTMNAEKLRLFSVYVIYQEVKKRFHLQLDPADNRFKIAGKDACPEPYRHLEAAFHEAILAHHDLAE